MGRVDACIGACRVWSGRAWSGRVRPGQAGSGQAGSGHNFYKDRRVESGQFFANIIYFGEVI